MAGAVCVFDVGTGNELHKLMAADAGPEHGFGNAVGIDGMLTIVGAIGDGSAYLFNVETGKELFKLTGSDSGAGHQFGNAVNVSGEVAIVGAHYDGPGSAFLFDVHTGNEIFKLRASDAAPADYFGGSVAISGPIAIVGVKGKDDKGPSSGAAYLFDVTTGEELFKLTASDGAERDSFGSDVSISGNLAIVGAFAKDGVADRSGAAYLFDVTTGRELAKWTASDGQENDIFGTTVSISDGVAMVGAFFSDLERGDPDVVYFDAGSAYVFLVVPEPGTLPLIAAAGLALLAIPKLLRRHTIYVLLVMFATSIGTAHATNMWMSTSDTRSPLGEVPFIESATGSSDQKLHIWARPDAGKTLMSWSLNLRQSNGDVIEFTDIEIHNPTLGEAGFPPKPAARYKHINDGEENVHRNWVQDFQAFSIIHSEVIGAGIGHFTSSLDPLYDSVNDAWLLATATYNVVRPGTTDLFLQIGSNGILNQGRRIVGRPCHRR